MRAGRCPLSVYVYVTVYFSTRSSRSPVLPNKMSSLPTIPRCKEDRCRSVHAHSYTLFVRLMKSQAASLLTLYNDVFQLPSLCKDKINLVLYTNIYIYRKT